MKGVRDCDKSSTSSVAVWYYENEENGELKLRLDGLIELNFVFVKYNDQFYPDKVAMSSP